MQAVRHPETLEFADAELASACRPTVVSMLSELLNKDGEFNEVLFASIVNGVERIAFTQCSASGYSCSYAFDYAFD